MILSGLKRHQNDQTDGDMRQRSLLITHCRKQGKLWSSVGKSICLAEELAIAAADYDDDDNTIQYAI